MSRKQHIGTLSVIIYFSAIISSSCGRDVHRQGRSNESQITTQHLQLKPSSMRQSKLRGRFLLTGESMIATSVNSLTIIDVKNPLDPKSVREIYMGEFVNNLSTDGAHLIVGGDDRSLIFNIGDLARPIQVGTFNLSSSCNFAIPENMSFFTFVRHTRAECRNVKNKLSILTIKDPAKPTEAWSIQTDGLGGLNTAETKMVACDRVKGLSLFNLDNPNEVSYVQFSDMDACRDIWTKDKLIIVSGSKGITQFKLQSDGTATKIGELKVTMP
jgi:hypothetical protein